MTATFIFLMIALKIPIVALFLLVRWAIKQETDTMDVKNDDGGTKVPPHPHRNPRPRLPRAPRRGPHGDPVVPAPPRVRSVVARSRHHV